MPKPLKVRRANEIVGLFILLAAAITVSALILGPRTQGWFAPTRTLAIHLPPEGSLGLRRGSDVQILGSVVGAVEDILVTDDGRMVARVDIRGNFIRFVREDSQAIIRKPLGIGDASVEITRGRGAPLPERNAVLASTADKGPTQLMDETLAAIRDEALPALKETRDAIAAYAGLATELRTHQSSLQQALQHFNRVGTALERREGLAGMLLFDPGPATELRAALPRLRSTLDELNAALAATRAMTDHFPRVGADAEAVMNNARAASTDARQVAAALPELERSLKRVIDTLPAVLLQSQQTLYEFQRLTEGAQRSWFFRSHIDQPEDQARLRPDRVGTDR